MNPIQQRRPATRQEATAIAAMVIAPHDWAAGRDPHLDTAVRLALQALSLCRRPDYPFG